MKKIGNIFRLGVGNAGTGTITVLLRDISNKEKKLRGPAENDGAGAKVRAGAGSSGFKSGGAGNEGAGPGSACDVSVCDISGRGGGSIAQGPESGVGTV